MTIEEEISSHLDMKPRKIKAETKKIVITKSKYTYAQWIKIFMMLAMNFYVGSRDI